MMEMSMTLFLSRQDTFRWGIDKVGLFFMMAGVVIAIVQGGLIGRLTKAFGEWPLAITGPIFVTIGMACFTWTGYHPLVVVLLLGGAINAAGRSLQHPSMTSLLSKNSSRDTQGVVFGMYHGLSSLARVFGPMIAGAMYALHATGPFVTAGTIAICAALWTALLRATSNGETATDRVAESIVETA